MKKYEFDSNITWNGIDTECTIIFESNKNKYITIVSVLIDETIKSNGGYDIVNFVSNDEKERLSIECFNFLKK